METKEQLPTRAPRRRGSRLWIIILSSVVAIVIIALAVGLGVGLTRRHDNDSDSDAGSSSTPSSSSTMSPVPTSSIVPTVKTQLWQPAVNTSWQIVLSSPLTLDLTATSVEPNVDAWDIDMFTNTNDTINYLHNMGKHVICYFSAGSYEPKRPDSAQFHDSDKGTELEDWPGEHWLNLKSQNVRDIMTNRIKYAAAKGCDAIDPDNVDGYNNDNGLGLTAQDSIDFVSFLSDTAAKYNMSTGLKNAAGIIPSVLSKTAFNVNEQCVQYKECGDFSAYITAGKPVFHIEYPKGDKVNDNNAVNTAAVNNVCSNTGAAAGSNDYSTVIKNMNLNGWVQFCNDQTSSTPCSDNTSKAKGYTKAATQLASTEDDYSDDIS